MYSDNWRKYFAKPTFRKGQDVVTDKIAARLDQGTFATIAELPTGVGKSFIAMALAKCADQAYVVTSQNILIDQYVRDFALDSDFKCIKGKQNYACKQYTQFKTCKDGSSGKHECHHHKHHGKGCSCTYKSARDDAMAAKIAFTNSTYFALACRNGEMWPTRSLAIIDEAHNLPKDVMGLTEISISERELLRLRISKTLPFDTPIVSVDDFCAYMDELKEDLNFALESALNGFDLHLDVDLASDLLSRIDIFMESVDSGIEWIVDYENGKRECVTARPLDTAYFAKSLFFNQAQQYVMQSATIVNPKQFVKELGLEGKGWFIPSSSPFDLSRRPIYPVNVGPMNKNNIQATLPKIAKAVEDILRARPDEKGIVHTHSYEIFKYLKQVFEFNPRCIFPDPKEKATLWKEHQDSESPTVIFSPSLTEGVDGIGDSVRFQVICKIPYPNLGDRRIKIKADRDGEWYQYQTAKAFIQTIGRGMRSEDDWCHNFVLDSGFSKFVVDAKLPNDIVSTIQKYTKFSV